MSDAERLLFSWFCPEHWQLQTLTEQYWIVFSIYYGSLIGLPAKKTPFNEQFTWYGGSQWQTLSRKCIYYVKNFIRENPRLIKYYEKTLVPDESLIQTILINNPDFNICCDNKRYIDFTGTTGGHPRVLTSQDYETITTGGFHFARKFEQNSDVLDMLDAYIFSQGKV